MPALTTNHNRLRMLPQASAPDAPSAGVVEVYFKQSDGRPYWKDSAGVEHPLGSSYPPLDVSHTFYVYDDFAGGNDSSGSIGQLGWFFNPGSSGSVAYNNNVGAVYIAIGTLELHTGAHSGGNRVLLAAPTWTAPSTTEIFSSFEEYFDVTRNPLFPVTRFRVSPNQAVFGRQTARVGLLGGSPASFPPADQDLNALPDPPDGFYFEATYDGSSVTHWLAVIQIGGDRSTADTGLTYENVPSWWWLKILPSASALSVDFAIRKDFGTIQTFTLGRPDSKDLWVNISPFADYKTPDATDEIFTLDFYDSYMTGLNRGDI